MPLCVKLERSLSAGSTVSIKNKLFKIEQNKFAARTKVTILLSEKHGLRALINGAFYPIYPIDKITYNKQGVARSGDFPAVVVELLTFYLLKDAKKVSPG